MFDYILKNKEWIFSGIGVSAITIIFLVFKNFWRKNQNIETIPNSTAGSQAPTITSDIPQDDIYKIVREWKRCPHYISTRLEKNMLV